MERKGLYTTKVKTQNGNVYDLGKGEYPPRDKDPGHPNPANLVIDAWTEWVKEA